MENYFDRHNKNDIINNIQNMYKKDERPWIIGYSGGKDSSTTVQLIFEALAQLKNEKKKLHKPVYIIFADTLVDNPVIINFISEILDKINKKANKLNLPIYAKKVYPKYKESFWTLLIGRGYPSPRQKFRWCTDRLKIRPTTDFIQKKLSDFNEVIVVLGVRKGESASRDQVLNNSEIKGKKLRRHQSLNNAYIYSPIEELTKDDVWKYLLNSNNNLNNNDFYSPWETSNNTLYQLYRNSDAECPMTVTSTEDTKSCGNSRFGCWTCTVVKNDKSLKGFVESGKEWLIPLLRYRKYIYEIRDNRNKREKKRKNGKVYTVTRNGQELRGLGPFTLKARKEMFKKLLKTQKEITHLNNELDKDCLIKPEEIKFVRKEWIESGDISDSLPQIYKDVYDETLPWDYDNEFLFNDDEISLLTDLCIEENIEPELIKKLISIEENYIGYKYRHNIYNRIFKLLNEDWIHYNKIKHIKNMEVNINEDQ